MHGFDQELLARLDRLRGDGLYRELRRSDSPSGTQIRVGGQTLLNFASNDYLGLANEPLLKEAAIKAVEKFGAGAGASRLICGSQAPHHELDETLAAFKGTAAALSFSSGYAAATGAIVALLGKDDVVVVDKLAHACLIDAARLCGAKLRIFDHNDLGDLEKLLRWAADRGASATGRPRLLIVTESVFSMDGNHAPLRELVELKDRYGAWLMVDEAHATGLYGQHGRGLAEDAGVGERVEVQMGTLSKAIGAAGGYIAGSRALIDYLINRARTFIFTTAPPPAAAAAATAGIELVQSAEGARRRRALWEHVAAFRGQQSSPTSEAQSAILPILVGNETEAVDAAAALRARGIFLPAVRYPTVARGKARLRLTLTAAHTEEDLSRLRQALLELHLIRNQ